MAGYGFWPDWAMNHADYSDLKGELHVKYGQTESDTYDRSL